MNDPLHSIQSAPGTVFTPRPRWLPWLAGTLIQALALEAALGGPDGLTVRSGTAVVTQTGNQMNITVSQGAVLDWQHFNIGAGDTTRFLEPSASSVVWNRVFDQTPSQIMGNLQGNGYVVLWNPNGFVVGPNASINVGGLALSAARTPPDPSGGGGLWQYNGPPPTAKIINYGAINTAAGGSIFLIAERVENHGVLNAPAGTIGLYAGKEVQISDRPDGRGVSVNVTLPEGSVDNTGRIIADAGSIALRAQVVNQNGLIQANSVREQNGVIELVATEAVSLGPSSAIHADGGSAGVSQGGSVTIKSAGTYADEAGAVISVAGGAESGAGGRVEISAPRMSAVNSRIDGHAAPGQPGGGLTIDPDYITLDNFGSDSAGTGIVNAGDPPGTLELNVNSAFTGFTQITLQAKHDISLAYGTTWDLNQSTGNSAPGSILTLQAGGDIIFGDSSLIKAGTGWSVRMAAGADFMSPLSVVPGVGGIYFSGPDDGTRPNGSGSLQTTGGNIDLAAGKEVLVGIGYVGTTAGGKISITALSGNVDAGLGGDPNGVTAFDWRRNGTYKPVTLGTAGGIATTGGGDINITAGGDILSYLPVTGTYGIGKPGDLTLTAGGSVQGRFQVVDGTGRITAGTDVGAGSSPASLSLVAGGWDVTAGRDIILNEVLNPKGVFEVNALVPFQFDYAPDAYVNLNGGRSVQLMGNSPAVTSDNPDREPIYPPILDITAGAGGVHVGNTVILYPSAQGHLSITTTDGGPLYGGAPNTPADAPQLQPNPLNFAELIVSDSGPGDYTAFAQGHASTPVHSGSTGPAVELNISGDVRNLFLQSPTEATMTIGGNAQNFSYSGQNLSVNDVTRLTVAGDFLTRAPDTSVPISDVPNAAVFDPAQTIMGDLGGSLSYAAGQLTFTGIMTPAQRDFLLNPAVQQLDQFGNRVFDAFGNPVLVPATYTTDAHAINQLYTLSLDIPPVAAYSGFQVGGPGKFVLSARNMDLGVTQGIRSVGPQNNLNLAGISLRGADISITLAGDLDMTASQIASYNGGNIDLTAGGKINVGAQSQSSSDDTPKGIYTGHGGSVTVQAVGDIEVNGSRIASYDGGDVKVTSQQGTVDAGNGGLSSFTITTAQLNPDSGQVELHNDVFFSSGIVALTSRESQAQVGDITISAAKDITANSGGVLQLSLNGVGVQAAAAKVTLQAGGNIQANLSGIVGENVDLHAGGSVQGLVLASQNIGIVSGANVNVVAVGGGSVSVSAGAGGSVSGNILGGGSVSVSGGEINAAVASTGGSVATSGNSSGAKVGAFSGVASGVAPPTTQTADKTIGDQKVTLTEDDDETKKRGKTPRLTKTVGRVTVVLPGLK